eukprot:scaffold1169_cov367-Prasinococcus_capsulatus_cf.AAC.15
MRGRRPRDCGGGLNGGRDGRASAAWTVGTQHQPPWSGLRCGGTRVRRRRRHFAGLGAISPATGRGSAASRSSRARRRDAA